MIAESMLPEFDREMANTRRVLERVPDDKFDWTPHPKSGKLGWLAGHVANIPSWGAMTIQKDSIDIGPGAATPPAAPKTRSELLAVFDKNVAETRAAIAGANDSQMMAPWSLMSGSQTIFTMPKAAVLRAFVMNHLIHHRAQLGVYLRLNDIPVPAIYGPSADESGF